MVRERADTLRSLKRKIGQQIEFLENKKQGRERITMDSHIASWRAFKVRVEKMIKIN